MNDCRDVPTDAHSRADRCLLLSIARVQQGHMLLMICIRQQIRVCDMAPLQLLSSEDTTFLDAL